MLEQGLESDLRDIVMSNSSFGPSEIGQILQAVSEDGGQFTLLRDLVGDLEQDTDRSPATSVRLGVCQYLLGQSEQAIATLSNADGGAVAHFYLGKSHFSLGAYEAAISSFENAKMGGYDEGLCQLSIAEAKRYAGDSQKAMEILDQMFGPVEQTAEYLFQRGATVAALGINPDEVVKLYERAVSIDENHAGALFGLALVNDRHGNDELAFELYQRATECFPTHVGSLINLGVLYEDHGRFDLARRCFERVLEVYPTHARALLYLRDVNASGGEAIDPWEDLRREKRKADESISIADFELSVRSRNCLEGMGIKTIGDLTRISEAELLGSKNFGETSLREIREMLAAKGMKIGERASDLGEKEEQVDYSHLPSEQQVLMEKPISELNLSVRARKCMNRLGLATIGELVRKSGDELLESKNFGVTSLNEVREKLTQAGLKLRGD